MPLKLTSNVSTPSLPNVGEVTLLGDKVHIKLKPFCKASLEREGKIIQLIETEESEKGISGICRLGDIYTLEHGLEKLIVKVEENNGIYLRENRVNNLNSKTTFSVGLILLVFLITLAVIGLRQKTKRDFNQKSEIKLQDAISEYDKQTRESFVLSKNIALKLKEDGYKNDKLTNLLKNIEDSEIAILGVKKVDPKEFLDLTLQTSGFNSDSIFATVDDMFILDKKGKNIIQVNFKSKNAKITASSDNLNDINSIAVYSDRLFLNKSDGIYEVKNGALIERIKDDSKNFLFYPYSGNIYTIDKQANKIYRYNGEDNTFLAKTDWIAPGIETDFSKIIDMTIDGSIWLLSSSGKITKFTNGNPINMTLDGIDKNLTDPTAIYTNEELKYVYILDSNEGRVIVLEKNGNFKMQYESDSIKDAKDIAVSEVDGKIILLTGAKLMYIQI